MALKSRMCFSKSRPPSEITGNDCLNSKPAKGLPRPPIMTAISSLVKAGWAGGEELGGPAPAAPSAADSRAIPGFKASFTSFIHSSMPMLTSCWDGETGGWGEVLVGDANPAGISAEATELEEEYTELTRSGPLC